MVIAEKTWINLALADLEAAACNVSTPDCLQSLHGILLTVVVESIVDLVQQVEQVLSIVLFADFVIFTQLDNDDGDFTLRV